jgi:hypothetical protein
LLPPLASQMHEYFDTHSNGDLVQNRTATSKPSLAFVLNRFFRKKTTNRKGTS